MSRRTCFAVTAALGLLLATAASAQADRRVFLNGVELSNVDVGEREFSRAKVRFDAAGNIHIQVEGLEIGTRQAPPAEDVARAAQSVPRKSQAPRRQGKPHELVVAGSISGRFFVANKGASSGKVQVETAVYVNGRLVATVRPGDRDGVIEITKYVRTGKNRVRVVAKSKTGSSAARRSYSPNDALEVTVGEGEVAKGVVTIRRSVATYRRAASETGADERRFAFVVER